MVYIDIPGYHLGSSAPAIFQKTMDSILQGMEGVACFLNDILVTGSSEEEHLKKSYRA